MAKPCKKKKYNCWRLADEAIMEIEVGFIKLMKIKIIMSFKGFVKKIIKVNILDYFIINKKKEIKELNNLRQS